MITWLFIYARAGHTEKPSFSKKLGFFFFCLLDSKARAARTAELVPGISTFPALVAIYCLP